MFTRRVQIALFVAVLVIAIAYWLRPVRLVDSGEPLSALIPHQTNRPSTAADTNTGDKIGAPQELLPPITTGAQLVQWQPELRKFMFQAGDLRAKPDPSNLPAWHNWRSKHPFTLLLDAGDIHRIQRENHYLATFNEQSKLARENDLSSAKNVEDWKRLQDLRRSTESLSWKMPSGDVLNVMGLPTAVERYRIEIDGSDMLIAKRSEVLSAEEIGNLAEPFSIVYQPPNWRPEHRRGDNYFFRALRIDFTEDGRLFQWHFSPLPFTEDW